MLGGLAHIGVDKNDLGAGLSHGDRHVGTSGGFPSSRFCAGADDGFLLGGRQGKEQSCTDNLISFHNLEGTAFGDVGIQTAGRLFIWHVYRLPSQGYQSWESHREPVRRSFVSDHPHL